MQKFLMTAPISLLLFIAALLVLIPGLDSDPALRPVRHLLVWVWALSFLPAMWLWATRSGSRFWG